MSYDTIAMTVGCLLVSLLFLLLAAVTTPVRRLLRYVQSPAEELAIVPARITYHMRSQPYDPLEQSSWHKAIREHIRQLARTVHVPPDLEESGMPEELHRHMEVLAMLQDHYRKGNLARQTTASLSTQDLD